MTTTRILALVMGASLVTVAPVLAQGGLPTYSPPGRSAPMAPTTATRIANPGSEPTTSDSLQRMTMPAPPAASEASSIDTLNSASQPGLPPGSYASPWYTDGPGCCGPLGRHGDVGYELYVHTGPTLAVGGAQFVNLLKTGWMVGMGGRTLLYNRAGDAAWVIDLGLNYQYNRGSLDEVGLFIRQPPIQNQFTGQVIQRPDLFQSTRIRGLHRTAVNLGLGRDWWLWGPGNVGYEQGRNLRFGPEIGVRYGTTHVDLVPNSEEDSYSRRQNAFTGMYLGGHIDFEAPFGSWIWFAGMRFQYGVDYTNVVPPIDGDVQYFNFLMTTGFRF